jgi:hypothetical protein
MLGGGGLILMVSFHYISLLPLTLVVIIVNIGPMDGDMSRVSAFSARNSS